MNMKNKVRKLSESIRKRKIKKLWGGNLVGATAIVKETKEFKEKYMKWN